MSIVSRIVLFLLPSFCHLQVRDLDNIVPAGHLLFLDSNVVEAEANLLDGLLDLHLMTLALVLL
jgi:hypothetical protein